MTLQNRRDFVLSVGAVATSMASQVEAAQLERGEPPADPITLLNAQFRTLYGANRQELLESTPLAALTLIGTGELWRVEFGQVAKSYPPTPWIANVKGLMHGVIATQATWARLVRDKSRLPAKEDAKALAVALSEAARNAAVGSELPPAVAASVLEILKGLRDLASGWTGGKPADPNVFPETLERLRPTLEKVIDAAGEAIYQSIVRNLRSFESESDPGHWQQCLVGVCGVGFARRDNIEIAAAMSVLGRDSVGLRLLYLENAFTIPDGIAHLAAALADRALGQAVFGDPYRMWRDLLGDVAARHAGGGFFPELGRPG